MVLMECAPKKVELGTCHRRSLPASCLGARRARCSQCARGPGEERIEGKKKREEERRGARAKFVFPHLS